MYVSENTYPSYCVSGHKTDQSNCHNNAVLAASHAANSTTYKSASDRSTKLRAASFLLQCP